MDRATAAVVLGAHVPRGGRKAAAKVRLADALIVGAAVGPTDTAGGGLLVAAIAAGTGLGVARVGADPVQANATVTVLVLDAEGIETAFALGPGLGEVGANYAALGAFEKSVLCFAMLLGRLELFTVLVLLSPAFWRD